MKKIFLGILLLSTFAVYASEDPVFEMNKSWVGSMKKLLLEIEKKEAHLLVKSEDHFLEKFQLIQSAWADSRYNCFYGGWPSQKKNNLCQHPVKTNPSYSKSSCKVNEFQCQPLLFNQGLCVKNSSQQDKKTLFSQCEKKFQIEKKGDYEFLKKLNRDELTDLKELSILAADLCKDQASAQCKEVNSKFKRGMSAIQQSFNQTSKVIIKQKPSSIALNAKNHELECHEEEHNHEKLARGLDKFLKETNEDDLYSKIKNEFLSSPFCDPRQVLNDPNDRPSPFLLKELYNDLKKIDPSLNKALNESSFEAIVKKYQLSDQLKSEALPILQDLSLVAPNYEKNRTPIGRIKGLIIQEYLKDYKDNSNANDKITDELVQYRIFKTDESNKPVCPFVSKDAFDKAMKGREAVLKKFGANIPNKNVITIVDYTRPSNERRLFVIDIASGKVLHNTWVAHGSGGTDHGQGEDGFGSNPKMSNKPGSLKSSDGFILAKAKSYGKLFGNNLLLSGIDRENSQLAARSVVMHGWHTPFDSYTTGASFYDNDDPPFDVIRKIQGLDFKTSSQKDVEKAVSALNSTLYASKFMAPTEGCLGVTNMKVKHLDRKGRDKSQLDLLRDDLPGSIIFNYSGPDMKSNFF